MVILLLEADDAEAERILTALSEGGLACRVCRCTARDGLCAALAGGAVELVLAALTIPGLGGAAVLELARSLAPAAPVVFVAGEADLDAALELVGRGAAGCVPARCLERLVPALVRAAAEAGRRRDALADARRRDDFLARVAHQLRTPLNAILGWASMLRARRLDEPARARAVEIIERNARWQARMIEELLDVSRILTGTLRLEPEELELLPAVAAAVEALRPSAEAAGVALSAALDEEAGAVAADPERLQQVLRELITNAVRCTPRGGRVEVGLARVEGGLRVDVADTGRGLRADELAHLFDRFRRLDAHAHHGLGVGLSIARHLVEAHGGTLSADSPGEGLGATFTVRLPSSRRA
jgi:signal transduction histidine kinase